LKNQHSTHCILYKDMIIWLHKHQLYGKTVYNALNADQTNRALVLKYFYTGLNLVLQMQKSLMYFYFKGDDSSYIFPDVKPRYLKYINSIFIPTNDIGGKNASVILAVKKMFFGLKTKGFWLLHIFLKLQMIKFKLRARFANRRMKLSIRYTRLLNRYRRRMKSFRPILIRFINNVNQFVMERNFAVALTPEFLQKLLKTMVGSTDAITETTRNYTLFAWLKMFCTSIKYI